MRDGFRVLSVTADKTNWTEHMVADYLQGGYEGIYIRVGKGDRLDNLVWVRRISGLKYLEVNGRVIDDTDAFRIGSLRELILLTRCTAAVPRITAPGLERLGIDDRPGKSNVAALPNLRALLVWSWVDADLGFLNDVRGITSLHVEGDRGMVSLNGIEECLSLEEIEIVGMRVSSLSPLADLSNLRRLWVIGDTDAQNVLLDLHDLGRLSRLEELRLTLAGAVQSVRPLAGLSNLRDIRLRGTRVIAGDEGELRNLGGGPTVVLPNE